jgi:hypothetical protein
VTWQYQDGEPFYVNVATNSGASALIIHPRWMQSLSKLKNIPGVTPGDEYYHSSNMTTFPKRQHLGKSPSPYGLPLMLENETALQALLQFLYPQLNIEHTTAFTLSHVNKQSTDSLSASAKHLQLLSWFEQFTGQVLTWEQLQQAPDTVTISAKGIYKPKWLDYALSIRQTLDSPYSDQEPIYQDDGSWLYLYAQEESQFDSSAALFTNQGLKRCMDDGVPVAILKQLSKKPDVTRYQVLGLANVISWDNGFFTLKSTTLVSASSIQSLQFPEQPATYYTPQGVEDHRRRIVREIALRQGQAAFRSGLLTAYEGRCAITACSVVEVLEAAHITPYLGPETNHISNGLLLRSDLHTLWDKGFIYLKDDLVLGISPRLTNSKYALFAGRKINLPSKPVLWPSLAAIRAHRIWACSSWSSSSEPYSSSLLS